VMEVIAATLREIPPPPTPPRHAAHGGRGEEGVSSCFPPATSEASGGKGSGVGGAS
jgi:hypothetical protein